LTAYCFMQIRPFSLFVLQYRKRNRHLEDLSVVMIVCLFTGNSWISVEFSQFHASLIYSQSTTNKMRVFSVYLFLLGALHVSDEFFVHQQEVKTAYTASGICQTVTATCWSSGWNVPSRPRASGWLALRQSFVKFDIGHFKKHESRYSTFAEYNKQDAIFHNLFISVRRSTYFRRLLCLLDRVSSW